MLRIEICRRTDVFKSMALHTATLWKSKQNFVKTRACGERVVRVCGLTWLGWEGIAMFEVFLLLYFYREDFSKTDAIEHLGALVVQKP